MRKFIFLLIGVLAIGVTSMATTNILPAKPTPKSKEAIKQQVLSQLSSTEKYAGTVINFKEGAPDSKVQAGKTINRVFEDCAIVVITIIEYVDENEELVAVDIYIDIYIFECP